MDTQTASHHTLSGIWAGFCTKNPQGYSGFPMRPVCKKRLAREVLRTALDRKKVNVHQDATMSVSQLSGESMPAVFFTRKGQNPVVIKERFTEGFLIQLWDGRESICRQQQLEKTLEPEGYFLSESNPKPDHHGSAKSRKIPMEWVAKERRHLVLGFANGVMTCSLLLLFVWGISQIYTRTFPGAAIAGNVLTVVGLLASLFATFGFLQFRSMISRRFENRSRTIRSKQQDLPTPFAIKALVGVESGRQIAEGIVAPLLLTAAFFAARIDPGAVSSWVIVAGLTLPSLVFLTGLPRLVRKWDKARCQSEELSTPLVESTSEDSPAIRILNLFLEHPDQSRSPIVNKVSFKISKGEKVGVFGKVSSEITILFQVISGLLKADHGAVWINGQIVSGYDQPDFGWFSEKTSLITGSLRENLALGAPRELSNQEIESVAALTGLDQIALYKEGGLDSPLSESGSNISEHDKMRILLTRSLVNRPDTLIFQAPRNREHDGAFREVLNRYLKTKDCTLLLGAKHLEQLDEIKRTLHFTDGQILSDGPTDLIDRDLSPITKG